MQKKKQTIVNFQSITRHELDHLLENDCYTYNECITIIIKKNREKKKFNKKKKHLMNN